MLSFDEKRRRIATLLEKARSKRYPMGVATIFDCPELLEAVGKFDVDWIQLDLEHTLVAGPRSVANMVRAAELSGLVTIVKMNSWDPIAARDILDTGAEGIMVPFVNSADQLREVIAACRFPPDGNRGFCSVPRALGYATASNSGRMREITDYYKFSNEDILIVPTIETADAVDNIDEILAVPDCPIFCIGTSDLEYQLVTHDDMAYLDKVTRALSKKIRAAGKLVMLPIRGPGPHGVTVEQHVNYMEYIGTDLPFTGDAMCLGFGVAEATRIRDAARAAAAPDKPALVGGEKSGG